MAGGRPPKYNTKEEMQEVIDSYFNDCKRNRIAQLTENYDGIDDVITDDVYPAVSGLALCLGMTRQGLIEYSEKDEFSDTVKEAKSRVESFLEQRLFMPQPTGVIFNLKNNYGWKDAKDVDLKSSDGSMSPNKQASDLSDDELAAIISSRK